MRVEQGVKVVVGDEAYCIDIVFGEILENEYVAHFIDNEKALVKIKYYKGLSPVLFNPIKHDTAIKIAKLLNEDLNGKRKN